MPASKLDRRYEDLNIGDHVYFNRCFEQKDFGPFSRLSGDFNPLHHDAEYAALTAFAEPIVPMHMTAAPLSAIAGMMLPGHRSLYLGTDMRSLKPLRFGQEITYSAKIAAKNDAGSILSIKVIAFDALDVLFEATMSVQVRDDVPASSAPRHDEKIKILSPDKPRLLITGAGGHIGRCIGLAAARQGWNLVLQSRGNPKTVKELAAKYQAMGAQVSLIKSALETDGGIKKILAALSKDSPITDIVHAASPPINANLSSLMAVNFTALRKLCAGVIPNMLCRQSGSIVLLGSSAAQFNPSGWENYTAAKAAASQYTEALNTAYGPHGITGWTVAPGYVDTPFSAPWRNSETPSLLPEQVAEEIITCLQKARDGSRGQYIWMAPGVSRSGIFGFHSPNVKAPMSGPLNRDGADQERTQSVRMNDTTDNVLEMIRNYIGLDAGEDMSTAGVDISPGWDSLKHIQLMLFLEETLGVTIGAHEIEKTKTAADFCDLVAGKL